MPSDDYALMGTGGEGGEWVYTVMAALSSVFLAVALVLVWVELQTNYNVMLFWFRG